MKFLDTGHAAGGKSQSLMTTNEQLRFTHLHFLSIYTHSRDSNGARGG